MSTNLAMATDAICRAFDEAWPDDRVEWPNVTYSDPRLSSGTEPWAVFDLYFQGGGNAAIGSRVFCREGNFVARIFVPAGERGLERANDLGMTAVNAFEGKTIDGVTFNNVGLYTVGPDGAGWFQVNVRGDFEFDEVKA